MGNDMEMADKMRGILMMVNTHKNWTGRKKLISRKRIMRNDLEMIDVRRRMLMMGVTQKNR